MPSRARAGTMSLTTQGGNPMQVTALAEAVMGSRRADGAISLEDLKVRLSRAGLEEFARAVASLRLRRSLKNQDGPDAGDKHPWF